LLHLLLRLFRNNVRLRFHLLLDVAWESHIRDDHVRDFHPLGLELRVECTQEARRDLLGLRGGQAGTLRVLFVMGFVRNVRSVRVLCVYDVQLCSDEFIVAAVQIDLQFTQLW
jgi:hypothetical protein